MVHLLDPSTSAAQRRLGSRDETPQWPVGRYRRPLGLVAVGLTVAVAGAVPNVLAQSSAGRPTATAERAVGKTSVHRDQLPLAPLRMISFTVDEGTAMWVDLSPDGRLLAFDLLGQIFTLPIQGGDARQLTTGPAFAERPTFSRDGRFIRFSSDRAGDVALWRIPTIGGAPERVPPADTVGVPFEPGFSYSGVQLPGALSAPGGRYRVTLSNGKQKHPFCSDYYLDVSDTVAKTSTRIVRAPVCNRAGYAGDSRGFLGSAFTPDGRAFLTAWGGKLRRVELATGTVSVIPFRAPVTLQIRPLKRFPHRIADDSLVVARRIEHPRISPDGRWVVFGAFDRLWIMPLVSGTETSSTRASPTELRSAGPPRRLTTLDVGEFAPVWSPDGQYVAFVTGPDTRQTGGAIYRVHVEGARATGPLLPERLTPEQEGGWYNHLTYTADGRQLVALRATKGLWNLPSGGRDEGPTRGDLVWIDANGGSVRSVSAKPVQTCRLAPGQHLTAATGRSGAVLFSGYEGSDSAVVSLVQLQAPSDAARPAPSAGSPAVSAVPLLRVRLPLWLRHPRRGSQFIGAFGYDCLQVFLSPAGDRALVWADALALYLVDVPPAAGDGAPMVVIDSHAPQVRRLTVSPADGAEFPAWAPDGRSFTYAHGRTLYHYDLARADSLVRDSIARVGTRRAVRGPAYRPAVLPITVTLPRDRPRGTIVFRHARLLTMRNSPAASAVIERGDLVVRDRRIIALGPSGTVAIPAGAHIIDASGRTIMPGLFDLHNHVQIFGNIHRARSSIYEANLAYGVLTSRDPQAGSLDFLTYEDRVAAGQLLGPRIYNTGFGVSFPWSGSMSRVSRQLGLEDARTLMQRYADVYQVSYIKDYEMGRRPAGQHLVMAAAERGLNVVSHTGSYRRLIQNAIDGLGGTDHFAYEWPLYADARALLTQTHMTLAHFDPTVDVGAPVSYFMHSLDSMVLAWMSRWQDSSFKRSLEKLDSLRRHDSAAYRLRRDRDSASYAMRQTALGEIARIAAAGGHIAVANHGEQPGYGTHMQIWVLVDAGMPALDALRSATLRGAEALGMDRDLGSLEVGKLADLIVLERNPLEKIQHTLHIQSVLFNGRLYDHATLNELWPQQRTRPLAWWQAEGP